MSLLCRSVSLFGRGPLRVAVQPVRSFFFKESHFADPFEHATGLERKELEAERAGDPDPFEMNALKRGPGTKDQPNIIKSAFTERIVGCLCDEDDSHIKWMWLHKNEPRRCACGHWFKLVEKAPVQPDEF